MIPLSVPNFEGNETEYVLDAVSQGWVSTGGAYVTKLEQSVSSFVCVDDAVACQSGTAALHLSLLEAGVKSGDLVIAPTLTFIAAINPIRYCNADPVFIDCDDSLCIAPAGIKKFIESNCEFRDGILIHRESSRRVKAIVVVHVFGNMADMESIMDIANQYQLKVIEDATEALGTRYIEGKYMGKFAGTIGDFGAYSFNGNKIITTGGGGIVVAKDKKQLDHIRYLSTQAKDDPQYYVHNEVGYNYRMTNVQAAIGVAQMEKIHEFIQRKNDNYDLYREIMCNIDDIELLSFRKGIFSNKWFYSIYITADKYTSKDLVRILAEKGIQTRCIWDLIHKQKPYASCVAMGCDNSEYYAEHVINIPCSTGLTRKDIVWVGEMIRMILDNG